MKYSSRILFLGPNIRFHLREKGIEIHDEKSSEDKHFYFYDDLDEINLSHTWFPRLAKILRCFTWILNAGVPFFPDAQTFKKASLEIKYDGGVLNYWLTDVSMVRQAKILKKEIQGNL